MAATVSIVIPCYNAACWIRDALESVLAQASGDGCEVIVVDDSRSTDDLEGLLRRDFGFVRLVKVYQPGAGAARNLGTSLASGEFIQYLDADDRLADRKIGRQRDLLRNTGADVAYGDWQYLELRDGAYSPGAAVTRRLEEPELDLLTGFWCPTAAYLFRKSMVDRVGGWNCSLHYEDDQFMHDCVFQGARFVYSPGVMAYYRIGPRPLWRGEPAAAVRDHYGYVRHVEAHWAQHGGVGDARRQALARCLARLARRCADLDRVTFEAILDDLERLSPGYVPESPARLKIASKLFGYRRTEALARWYRRARRAFMPLARLPR